MANSKKGTKQVNPPTPKQRVISGFGGKHGLVDAIMDLVGENNDEFRSTLLQVSNKRLMSHHHNAKRMVAQFGSKDGVIEAICAQRFPKGNLDEHFRAKLETFSAWRLMDEHRQSIGATAKAKKISAASDKLVADRRKRRTKLRVKRAARG